MTKKRPRRKTIKTKSSPKTIVNRAQNFLAVPGNSHAREVLLRYRLLFDLHLAAAGSGYYLNTYFDQIDHDGFDVIFESSNILKKIQLKTLSGSTSQWQIYKRILRPSKESARSLEFREDPEGIGVGGGVIRTDFKFSANILDVEYFYTDSHILKAIEHGVIKASTKRKELTTGLLNDLSIGPSKEKITLTKGHFIRAKTPSHLLALMGLPSSIEDQWTTGLESLLRYKAGSREEFTEDVCFNAAYLGLKERFSNAFC